MSDFDREKEREKLREKYEQDKQKREASERMSELLLQGATMTNRHCPECHSPVFRHEGQEFCPTCQQVVTEDGDLVDPADAGAGADTGADSEAASNASPDTDAQTDTDAEPAPSADAHEPSASEAAPERGRDPGADAPAEAEPEPDVDRRPATTDERRPARVDPPARSEPSEPSTPDAHESTGRRKAPRDRRPTGSGFDSTEATLADEIAALTQQAAETSDIGRKRDLLAAAREAAETLQTIRRL